MNGAQRERLRFYLQHQQYIDQWARLPHEAARLSHKVLLTLLRNQGAPASDFGADVKMKQEIGPKTGSSCCVHLYKDAWSQQGQQHVSLCLEWKKEKSSLAGGSQPWLGILCVPGDGLSRSKALSDSLRQVANQSKLYSNGFWHHEWWPAVRHPSPLLPDHLNDLSTYRALVLKEALEIWNLFAPVIDLATAPLIAASSPNS